MNVPKWLLPAISAVAALALGVSMAFVGANFASKQVVEKAAGTETAQVVQPVATGLTNADVAALAKSGHGLSPVTGTVQVSKPGAKSVKPPLNREVDAIAAGHGSGDAPSSASSPTPSPSSPPDSSTVGVTPYVPSPTDRAATDPCAVVDHKTPIGCPSGLRSVVLALTGPPAPDFTAVPYAYPCEARIVPNSFAGHGSVDVTLTSTVPMTYSVHYGSTPPVGSTDLSVPHGVLSFVTTAAETNSWNDARSRDVAVASLPKLYTCATIPSVWDDGSLAVDITGTATDGTVVIHHILYNPNGPATPGPLRVQTFGSDAFVAYGEHPANQSMQIRAYAMTTPADATCQDVSALHQLTPVYSRTDEISSNDIIELNVPADYVKRTATGFRPAIGSVILVCGTWYNGANPPSFDRIHPLRTSQIVVESPALQVAFYIAGVYRSMNFPFGDGELRGDIAHVHAFATLDDGTPCGPEYDWYKSGPNPPWDVNMCAAPTDESFDTGQGQFADDTPANADVNLTIQVIGTNGRHSESVLRMNLTTPICIGCTIWQNTPDFNDYRVPLADPYSNPLDQPGYMRVYTEEDALGTSNVANWVVSSPVARGHDDSDTAIDSPPRMDTDQRMTVDTALTTPTDVTARLNFDADKAGSFRVTLHSPSGGPPCTVNGATSVVVGGEYPVARVTAAFLIPHLCHGAQYVATVDAIEGTDYLDLSAEAYANYGYNAYSPWLGDSLTTPPVLVHVQYTETVAVPAGSALTDLNLHLGVGDVHPLTDLSAGCASPTFTHTGTTTMALGSQVQVHLHYRVRPVTSAIGSPCTFPRVSVAPMIDSYPTIDLNAVMANPLGVQITLGAYTVVLKITPAS